MTPELPPAPAAVRIRQVALCCPDIWPVEQRIVAELGVAAVHRDPPNVFSMRNTVFAVGETFLEILQPTSPEAPSARFLAKHGGPGGYMLILQVDDADAARRRVEALGIRVVWEAPPATVHGVRAWSIHLHPADTGGTLISLDTMDPPGEWAWAGRVWRDHVHTGVTDGIVGVDLRSADPDALAERFGSLVGRPPDSDRVVTLDGGRVRIVAGAPGTRDQLVAVELHATDRARAGTGLELAGTTVRFV